MPNIYFIQEVNGMKVPFTIDRPANIVAAADAIIAAGFWFESEILSNTQVAISITDKTKDWDIEICNNLPVPIFKAVDKLVT